MAGRGGKRRDPARERFWRRAIRQQQQCGLAVPEFCRREGLKDRAFRWWLQEVARRDQQPSPDPEVRAADLAMILEGIDRASVRRRPRYSRPPVDATT